MQGRPDRLPGGRLHCILRIGIARDSRTVLKEKVMRMGGLLLLEWNLFAMIGVGFLLRRTGVLGREAQGAVTDLVLCAVLPCSIFSSFLGGRGEDMGRDFVTILLISVAVQIAALLYGRLAFRGENEDRRRNLAYGMICSNAGFLGIAIAEGVFGPAGTTLTSVYLIPQRVMMWSEGLAIYSGVSDVRRTIRKVVTHPCVISCILGIVFMAGGFEVPAFILTPVRTLGQCTTPLSMLVVGMILSEIDLSTLLDRSVVRYTVHRLIILPLGILIACRLLPVSRLVTGVSVLLAAMPAGATTGMLAARYGRDPGFATRMIIFSTLCSIPAIFVWSLVLR